MFISKQFRNFVHRKQFNLFIAIAFFEVKRANAIRFLFVLLKFCQEVCCASKIKLVSLAQERERFFTDVSVNRLLRHNCFLLVNCLLRNSAKSAIVYSAANFFGEKCFSIKFLLDVAIFSKRNITQFNCSAELSYAGWCPFGINRKLFYKSCN